jgi:hypothetical protein
MTEPLREMARRVARERARADAAEARVEAIQRFYSVGWQQRLVAEVNDLRADLSEARDKEKILMRSIARLTDPDWWLATLAEDAPWFDDMRDVFAAAADPSTT